MLNLNFLSLSLFVSCFHLPTQTVSGLILHPKPQSLILKQLECYVQKRTACPSTLCSQMGRKTPGVLQSQHISGERWLELSRCPSHDKTTFCPCFSAAEQPLTLEKAISDHTSPASPAADRMCHSPGGFLFNLSSPTSPHSSLTVSAAVLLT